MSYIVMIANAKRRSGSWGAYRRVAVVEIDDAWLAVERMKAAILRHEAGPTQPKAISERARGVVRIVETWERLRIGTTERSGYKIALRKAQALAQALNAEAAHDEWTAGGERLQRDF